MVPKSKSFVCVFVKSRVPDYNWDFASSLGAKVVVCTHKECWGHQSFIKKHNGPLCAPERLFHLQKIFF